MNNNKLDNNLGLYLNNKGEHSPTFYTDEAYLRLSQILEILPFGKTKWWNGVKEGIYPQPYKLGARITAWKVKDIRELLESFGGSND